MPVVNGIEAFRDALAAHDDEYVLIGGGACSILFDMQGDRFRATKDLDIVVLTNRSNPGFARDFWAFIEWGGYSAWKRCEGGRAYYYRFNLPEHTPNMGRLPAQIELFARHPDFELGDSGSEIAPLPFDEDISSLSAIILDDGYYEFICSNIVKAAGVPILPAASIIPLKMRAHVDLNRKHAAGRFVNNKDLTKHRSDVARLAGLLEATDSLPLEGQMREDAHVFMADFEQYAQRQTKRKLREELARVLGVLQRVYLG